MVALVLIVAAIFQRMTGLGFGLVGMPIVVLLLGPVEGVLSMMVNGLFLSFIMALGSFSEIDWRRAGQLILAGILVSPLAGLVTFLLGGPWLMIVVAGAAILSLMSSYITAPMAWMSGRPGIYIAGSVSGFLHITSGLSGPPLVAYALRVRWPQRNFITTIQVFFVALNLVTFAWRGLPTTDPGPLGIMLAATLIGTIIGAALQKRVPAAWVTRAMLIIAWVGTLGVLVRALWQLIFPG